MAAGRSIENVQFVDMPAQNVPEQWWPALHDVALRGFGRALWPHRDEEQVAHFVGSLDHFRNTRLDPQRVVAELSHPTQDRSRPRLAVAVADGEPRAFAYSYDNESGATPKARQRKHQTRIKSYRAIPELVVDPDWQKRRIGSVLGYLSLTTVRVGQLYATTYTSPNEFPYSVAMLYRMGAKATSDPEPIPDRFGPGTDPFMQQRFQMLAWPMALKLRYGTGGVRHVLRQADVQRAAEP